MAAEKFDRVDRINILAVRKDMEKLTASLLLLQQQQKQLYQQSYHLHQDVKKALKLLLSSLHHPDEARTLRQVAKQFQKEKYATNASPDSRP